MYQQNCQYESTHQKENTILTCIPNDINETEIVLEAFNADPEQNKSQKST